MLGHLPEEDLEAIATGRPAPPHLYQCPRCKERVAKARARRQLLAELPPQELPPEAYARVERRLFEAPAEPKRLALRWPALGLGMALAALAAFFLLWPRPEPPPAVAEGEPPTARELPTASLTVTLAAGAAEAREGSEAEWTPLEAGRTLSEGAELRTGDGRVALGGLPSTFALEGSSEVAFPGLRLGRVEALVRRGTLAASSAHGGEESLAVRAGPRSISPREVETAFATTRFAAEVLIEVERGSVRVSGGPEQASHLVLSAPARLRLADGAGLSGAAVERAGGVGLSARAVLDLARAERGARLDVGDLPPGARVQVDELGWWPGPLSGLFEPGLHRVRMELRGQPIGDVVVLAVEGGAKRVRPPERPAPEPDPSALAALSEAVRGNLPQLRGCYERWLKKDLQAAGRVELTLSLSADGRVQAVRVDGAAVPKAAARCFAEAARSWALPPLGAPQEVQVPLVLTIQR